MRLRPIACGYRSRYKNDAFDSLECTRNCRTHVRIVAKFCIQVSRFAALYPFTWDQICRRLDIKLRATSAFHPQGNGQAERSNQTVKTLLRVARHYNRECFDVLATAEMALNSAPIAKTKFSPYRLNYGFDPVTIPDVFSYANAREEEEPDSFIDRLNTEWKLSHPLLRKLKVIK